MFAQDQHIQFGAVVAAFAVLISATPAASASLIGDTATFRFTDDAGRNVSDTATVLEGAGPEFSLDIFGTSTRFFEADIEASSISIGYSGFSTDFTSGRETLSFESLDWFGDPDGFISAVTLTDTNVAGLTQADISFGEHSIDIDITGLLWTSTSTADLSIVATHRVPEPSTLALIGIGLAGIGLGKRKRRPVDI